MSIDPFLWLPDTVKLGLSDKTKWMRRLFSPMLLALWGCRLFSVTHSSYSLHPLPQWLFLETLLSLVTLGPQTSACKFGTSMWYGAGCCSQNWTLVLGMQEGSESKPEWRTGISTTVWVHSEGETGKCWKENLPWVSQKNSACLTDVLLKHLFTMLDSEQVLQCWGEWAGRCRANLNSWKKLRCDFISFSLLQTDLPSGHQAAFSSFKTWYYQWHWCFPSVIVLLWKNICCMRRSSYPGKKQLDIGVSVSQLKLRVMVVYQCG